MASPVPFPRQLLHQATPGASLNATAAAIQAPNSQSRASTTCMYRAPLDGGRGLLRRCSGTGQRPARPRHHFDGGADLFPMKNTDLQAPPDFVESGLGGCKRERLTGLFLLEAVTRKFQCPAVLSHRANHLIRRAIRKLRFDFQRHRYPGSNQAG